MERVGLTTLASLSVGFMAEKLKQKERELQAAYDAVIRNSLTGQRGFTISIGVAAFPEDSDSPSGLIQAADDAHGAPTPGDAVTGGYLAV